MWMTFLSYKMRAPAGGSVQVKEGMKSENFYVNGKKCFIKSPSKDKIIKKVMCLVDNLY